MFEIPTTLLKKLENANFGKFLENFSNQKKCTVFCVYEQWITCIKVGYKNCI